MMDKEVLHKEIDLIQACISRMAHDSFLMKGWMLTLLAAIWAFAIRTETLFVISAMSLVIIWAFWYLDAFFLCVEKMYREMYNWVIVERPKGNTDYLYNLDPYRFSAKVKSRFEIMFSVTLRCFYGIPFLLIAIILVWQILMHNFDGLCYCQ